MILLITLLVIFWITFSIHVVRSRPEFRKQLMAFKPWGLQFILHPLLVFSLVTACNILQDVSVVGASLCVVVLSGVTFNWGVEPWDVPQEFWFYAAFYCHHSAPLLACCNVPPGNASFSVAQALVLAHCWLLHTILALEFQGVVNKQSPLVAGGYWALGFAIFVWFFKEVSSLVRPVNRVDSLDFFKLITVLAPVVMQFIGRWSVFARLIQLKPDFPYDWFENTKQVVEPCMLIVAALIVIAST